MTVLAVLIVFASLLFVPYTERNKPRAKDPYRSFARSLRSEGDRRADTTRSVTGLLKRKVSYLSARKWNGKEDEHQQPETSDLHHGIRPVEGLLAESKTDNPDRDSSAYVSDTPRSGGYVPGDVETEEIEEADGEPDGDGRAKDA